MGAGVWWWTRRRAVVLDVVLALLSGAESAAEMPGFGDRIGVPAGPAAVAGFLLGAVLLLRRRYPVAVVLVSAASTPTESAYLLALVGLYSLGAYCADRRTVLGVAGVSLAAAVLVTYVLDPPELGGSDGLVMWQKALVAGLMLVGAMVTPVLLGLYAGARRRLVEGLRERARALELEQRLLAERAARGEERAREEERARIAREMHDVVAHRVSLMVVHAGAIQAVARRDGDAAAASAGLVGDIGRQALNELRQVLGVLRSSSSASAAGSAGEGGGAGPAGGEAARPVLADLDVLVAQSREAGMAVELAVSGEPRRLAAALEGTAYRAVQEALTNAHKHAGGAAVRVCVRYGAEEVAVSVVNDAPPAGAGRAPSLPSGGNGLKGMRERVEELAGRCDFGETESGGYAVSASLPTGSVPGARAQV